jgi:hypothetical protein
MSRLAFLILECELRNTALTLGNFTNGKIEDALYLLDDSHKNDLVTNFKRIWAKNGD